MKEPPKPVVIKLDHEAPSPALADPVLDMPEQEGRAVRRAAGLATQRPSRLTRLFWALLLGIIGTAISLAIWDWVSSLLIRNAILGQAITAALVVLVFLVLIACLREGIALVRLSRIETLRRQAEGVLAGEDLSAARVYIRALLRLYETHEELRWGRVRLGERIEEILDTQTLMAHAEECLLAPLDAAARHEVERAARQVAMTSAFVPLALIDLLAALLVNLRMIRRIAGIYGGRPGWIGGWRLTRAVMAHLLATGALAVGDDMLEPILGSGLLGKLSRRFGEGMVNGALTARVGLAAMELCRPSPFSPPHRPSLRKLIRAALAGVMMREK